MPFVIFRIGTHFETYEVTVEDLRELIEKMAEYHREHGNPQSVSLTLAKNGVSKAIVVDDIFIDTEDLY